LIQSVLDNNKKEAYFIIIEFNEAMCGKMNMDAKSEKWEEEKMKAYENFNKKRVGGG
jgi:hypothetical protein